MRRSLARWKVDPQLIVQRRLPWQVRKQQLKNQFWKDGDEEEPQQTKTPGIVVQISQAAKKRQRDPQLWSNLLDQALAVHGELSPQDMAGVLWSMSEARYQHEALTDEFVRSLSYRANVRAMVTAMLAVDRLGLPTDSLRAPFLQQLSGQCQELGFGDLRRVLMALARCWRHCAPVQQELLGELCDAIADKAEDEKCDPRDLVAVPQHLGRLRYVHPELLAASARAVAILVSSRLSVLQLDVLRAQDGFLMLEPLIEVPAARYEIGVLAEKCRLLGAKLLRQARAEEIWRIGSQLLGSEVMDTRVWSVWVGEVMRRREPECGRSRRIAEVRRVMTRQWGLNQAPEGLERALQDALRAPAT
ncbi:unnamed protein product [Polarella glacialis]|uniref:Uncharacterized protein n=1 Tax=Polarella glacialis TaxID=89957 RepID=A0A813G9K9_POLGL|nr:unnamed protein product [Polarella glacialis]